MLKREMTSIKSDYKVRKNSDMKMKVRGMKLKGKFIDFKFQVTIIYLIIERESNAGRGDVIYEKWLQGKKESSFENKTEKH